MKYIPLTEFKHAWIFRHQSMPLTDAQLAQIKPMSEERASTLWDAFVSKSAVHPEHFTKHDWPTQDSCLPHNINWESRWESDTPELPEEVLEHIDWEDNTTVYYCLNRQCVLETTWGLFKSCWKNFLFLDDGSLLIGKKRQQAVQFYSDGTCRFGSKPMT